MLKIKKGEDVKEKCGVEKRSKSIYRKRKVKRNRIYILKPHVYNEKDSLTKYIHCILAIYSFSLSLFVMK